MGNELQVMKLNIAICDDEKAIREQINELIEKEKTGVCLELYETGDGPLTEFNEDEWYSLVDYATVYSREDIRFTFKNGMEIKA